MTKDYFLGPGFSKGKINIIYLLAREVGELDLDAAVTCQPLPAYRTWFQGIYFDISPLEHVTSVY